MAERAMANRSRRKRAMMAATADIEAGLDRKPTAYEQVLRLLPKLSAKELQAVQQACARSRRAMLLQRR
jgi:hypothetical protein